MKIAQVAPLFESVPPKLYGGTERVIYNLTEALIDLGHEITLFAGAESLTRANLVPCHKGKLRIGQINDESLIAHFNQQLELLGSIENYDIVHFHSDFFHFAFCLGQRFKHITTLHNRLDHTTTRNLLSRFQQIPLVSISNAQRVPVPEANWVTTVYHGLPKHLYSYVENPSQTYLCFVGRLSKEKGFDRAVEIARQVGLPLKVAAKIDDTDQEYFKNIVEPLLHDPIVEYLGELNEPGKQALYGDALALVFPIAWPEPFGLVMIEAMACGTPVIAWANGSVPEVVDNGITGYVVNSIDEAVHGIRKIDAIDRRGCREQFELRFSSERMAADYLKVYEFLQNNEPLSLNRFARMTRPNNQSYFSH